MRWAEFRDVRQIKTDGGDLFIDVNRFGRMFIKAISKWNGYKTFNFTRVGYAAALKWIGEVPHDSQ